MVGVFVNEKPGEIARVASSVGLFAVQLHGGETGQFIDELRAMLPGREIWKAAPVRDKLPVTEARADRVLFDSFDKTAHGGTARGGTGRRFDWSLLEGRCDKSRTILAGGIDPENALRASALGCFAIDVNSGVEDSPGKKNHAKIKRLFENLRGGV
jgi:indole-3-glycerol phosphate synthase/phosphoribosylanthranilate isomerase